MSTITNTNSTPPVLTRSPFDHYGSAVVLPSAVKATLVALNTSASDIVASELKARAVTYKYVSQLVDAAVQIGLDDDFAVGVEAMVVRLLGKPDDKGSIGEGMRQPNPFLNLIRIADGEWVMKVLSKKANTAKLTWLPNRSGEKYAGVCRFAVRNGFSGAEMLRHFMSGEPFKIPGPDGEDKDVQATINAVIAEDRLQHKAADRKILSRSDWYDIDRIPAVAVIPFTERLLKAFTLSEGGLLIGGMRVVGNELHIYGDAGIEAGNPVLRQFKNYKQNMLDAAKIAVKEPEKSAVLPEEYVLTEEDFEDEAEEAGVLTND